MAKEINLVPDIKEEFIKTLKFRNLVFFICIVVASGSLIVILIFLSISGGQQGIIAAKQNTIENLEKKISDYSDLSDFLTIRNQLNNIATITENKTMISRTFNILSAIIPTGDDYINISEMNVDMTADEPNFRIEAQANAGSAPYIDYNVLDSFKKSMSYMRYDYGEYVDKNDESIPAYCIIETSTDGSVLRDSAKGYYAYWLIDGDGCNPAYEEPEEEEEDEDDEYSTNSSLNSLNALLGTDNTLDQPNVIGPGATAEDIAAARYAAKVAAAREESHEGYTIEEYEGQTVVRIWRTPQYSDWYKYNPTDDEPYIDLDGSIHNIAHFNSSCISYSGVEKENSDNITWSATNDSCKLVPDSTDDVTAIRIEESSNGRDSDEELVLRFTAVITFNPEVFNFNNHHLIALSPSGRYNVTDSYSQIQGIFAERAADCDKDDTACITAPTNSGSSSSSNDNNYEMILNDEEEDL